MIDTFLLLLLCAVDAVLIIGAIFLGWRPFSKAWNRIRARALRFLIVYALTTLVLIFAIPWIDVIFYEQGVVLNPDFMVLIAPAFVIIASLAAAITAVWRSERRVGQ